MHPRAWPQGLLTASISQRGPLGHKEKPTPLPPTLPDLLARSPPAPNIAHSYCRGGRQGEVGGQQTPGQTGLRGSEKGLHFMQEAPGSPEGSWGSESGQGTHPQGPPSSSAQKRLGAGWSLLQALGGREGSWGDPQLSGSAPHSGRKPRLGGLGARGYRGSVLGQIGPEAPLGQREGGCWIRLPGPRAGSVGRRQGEGLRHGLKDGLPPQVAPQPPLPHQTL